MLTLDEAAGTLVDPADGRRFDARMRSWSPADARRHFEEALRRTPGRPKSIAGIARAAEALGDVAAARTHYTRLIEMWPRADADRPELLAARRFLQSASR